MAVVTMRQLLEAGVHFGHQTRRWNPKMKRFIFGERNGIYIIDLKQTLERIDVAYSFVRDMVAGGGSILFVGTKKQTQDPVSTYATRCDMPYVNERWLGGMLTNFNTIAGRVKKMQEYQRMRVAGDFEAMPKKEALILSRELDKLERNLGGIRGMNRLPDAVFVIDTKKEHIAVTEANKLGLPVVAVVDTNCDPDVIQYVIPGNDDAIRAGTLMCRVIADAVEEGRFIAARRAARSAGAAAGAPAAPPVVSAEEEARRAEQQREARRQAALQQQEREARLAETARRRDAGEADVPAADVPAAEVPAAEVPAGRGSGADDVAGAAAPADQVAGAAAPADGAADTPAAPAEPAGAESTTAGSDPPEPSAVESPGSGAVAGVEAATGLQTSADRPAD